MHRILGLALFCSAVVGLGTVLAAGRNADRAEIQEALQELNPFIGEWKGSGSLPDDERLIWSENAQWNWRFKGDDLWLEVKIPDGKFFKGGDMKYDLDEEQYVFDAVTKEDEKQTFRGELKGTRLTLDRTDPKTKEKQQLQLFIAGGGVRFIYTYKVKPANRTLFSDRCMVAFTKKGESFGAADKKPECVVTGGLGTIAVSYNGRTYYVCCSGCRDAFNENPAKIIAEYNKKKQGGR